MCINRRAVADLAEAQNTAHVAVAEHPGLQDWLMEGEHGLSSENIVRLALGYKSNGFYPSDPADFRRCLLLIKAAPSLRGILEEKVAPDSLQWKALVENWDAVTSVFEDEAPNLYTNGAWSASKTYDYMKTLYQEAHDRGVADGSIVVLYAGDLQHKK